MRSLRAWFVRLAGLFGSAQRERELAAEVESHLQMHIEDNVRAGMSAQEARRQALMKLGGIEPTKELYRERRGLPIVETLLQDLRFALRTLRKNPGFTVIAVVTLALGIGANTAVFSMVNALLLHPYNFRELDRLVRVWEDRGIEEGWDAKRIAAGDAEDIRINTHVLEGLTSYRCRDLSLSAGGNVQSARGCEVTANFFEVLGVAPALGRSFSSAEEEPGSDQIAIVSYGFWQRHFAGEPSVIGKAIQLNGRKHTIIGIMPPGFDYPVPMELWIPLALSPAEKRDRSTLSLDALGRLREGVTVALARAELEGTSRLLQQQYPQTNGNRHVSLLQLRRELYAFTLPLFLLLQVAAGFVLLLAGANLANLLFARMSGRQKEIAVRTALGAGRWRLARLFVSETLLLSCIAGGVAILVSFWSVKLLRTSISSNWTMWVPGWDGIQVDRTVLLFTLALMACVGILLGLGFVLHSGKTEPYTTLKNAGRGSMPGREGKLRSALVVAQVMFALILLVCAGLTTDAFLRLANVYRGFQPENILRVEIGLPEKSYSAAPQIISFYQRVLAESSVLGGVNAAALISNSPASNVDNETTQFTIEGRPVLKVSETPSADLQISSPDYFPELRIPLIGGRLYLPSDSADAAPVAVISRSMANRFWPGGDALGRRIKLGASNSPEPWRTIIGVVADVRQNWWNPTERPIIYEPFLQAPRHSMVLLLRANGNPASYTGSVRNIVRQIDEQVALTATSTLESEITDSIAIIRIMGFLMALFGGVALLMASVGLYGVLSESVARRIPEIGIRLTLGAQHRDVVSLIVGQALKLTAMGLAIGVPIAFIANRTMSSLIFGIVNVNFAVLGGFTLLLVVTALIAAYVPTRRAMRVDPIEALRYE